MHRHGQACGPPKKINTHNTHQKKKKKGPNRKIRIERHHHHCHDLMRVPGGMAWVVGTLLLLLLLTPLPPAEKRLHKLEQPEIKRILSLLLIPKAAKGEHWVHIALIR